MSLLSQSFAAIVVAVVFAGLSPARAEDEHRQLKAHVHGHGKLNIAVEGKKVSLDLDVPGVDIMGTESFANAEAKAAALKEAQTRFADPLKVFVVPAGAGCKVAENKVEFESEDHKDGAAAGGGQPPETGAHADISAEFELTCENPAALTGIDFKYFEVFKNADSLDVAIVTSKGQTSAEVSRASPRLDLAGLM